MAICLLRCIISALLISLRNSSIVLVQRACSSLQQKRTAPSSLPVSAERDGMERRKGDTTRRLGIRPSGVARVKVQVTTKRRRDRRR